MTANRSFAARVAVALAALLGCAFAASAQDVQNIELEVDATQAPMKVIHAHLKMPARPGPFRVTYPKWFPGMHEPDGPIANLTGLKFAVGGKTIPWQRDLVDMFTFHMEIPQDANELEASFDYLEPSAFGGPSAGSVTDKLVVINWTQDVLYPAGTPSAKLIFHTKLTLPAGWKYGTALHTARHSGQSVEFEPVTLERLIDSPLIAGEYYRVFDLTPSGEHVHHEIDIVADSEAALAMPPEVQRGLSNVVAEAGKLFGARHYREYHFLLTLSDQMAHFGIEHHESNDSRLPERIFLSPDAAREAGGLLAHEYAHSWSGKFRRPQDLATPDFETPMRTDLLWVYEGNTSFCGDLLATRAGMWRAEDYRQNLANTAASLGPGKPGRTWRPLEDTADAVPGMFGGGGFSSWRRGEDYYEEGELIWLEVAEIIRKQTQGQKSFDDFAHTFYGGPNNGPEVKPYTFEDLVAALNSVAPYDWAAYFHERLTSISPDPPVGGIAAAGWKLAYSATPVSMGGSHVPSATIYTIGLNVGADGTVQDSIYGGPAFRAGVTSGMKIVGVNGRVFSRNLLNDAIADSPNAPGSIELLVLNNEYYHIAKVDYHGGLRYPHLERNPTVPDDLPELVRPRADAQSQ